jgi:fibronectin type 3 domain-containing protein
VFGPASTTGAAYCVYELPLGSAELAGGRQTLGLTWDVERMPNGSHLWLGLSNFENNTWDWYAGPADGVLTVDSLARYARADGSGYAVVVLGGSQPAALERITLGAPELRGLGCKLGHPAGALALPLNRRTSDTLPSSADLSAGFSSINDQGSLGACTAFSAGDGVFNYEMKRIYGDYGWDLSSSFNRVSPKYLYVKTGEDTPPGDPFNGPLNCPDDGRYLYLVVQWIADATKGLATEQNAPTVNDGSDPAACDNDWSAEALADADLLRSSDWEEITCEQAATIDAIKTVIATEERPVVIGLAVDQAFMDYDGSPEVWNYSGPFLGGHAVVIVGYDDTKSAFKVRNSWSTFWGQSGYCWIGYTTLSTDTAANPEAYDYIATFDNDVMARFCPGPPPTPQNVAATDGTLSDRVRVTWDAVDGATSYKVFRSTTVGGTYAQIGTTTAMQFENLISGTTPYWYKVKAANSEGDSGFSSPDDGYASMAAPTNVVATDGTLTDRVRVTWSAAAGAGFYQVWRATSANGTYTAVGTTTGTQIDDPQATTTTYHYKVRSAVSGTGYSCFAGPNSGYAGLAAPTNVAATDGTYTDRVRVSWTAASGAGFYQVWRATSANGTYTVVGTTTGTQIYDLLAVTTNYHYKVRSAVSGTGYSAFAGPDAGYAGLAAPTNVAATDGTYTDRVRITWNAAAGAGFYQVWRATSANGTYTAVGSTTGTQLDNFVGDSNVYYYKVRSALSGVGYSAFAGPDPGNKGP